MKKSFRMYAALLSVAMLLTACGSSAGTSATAADTTAAGTVAAAKTEEPAEKTERGEKVKLSIMHAYTKEEADSGDNTRKMPRETVLEWAENNKDSVQVEVTEVQHDDYETKLQALAAADDLPDVFTMKGSWVENFNASGLLADMTDAVNNCQWKDQYKFYLFDGVTTKDGKIIGAPMQYSATTIVYYNKDLWKQAGYDSFPATWDELLAAVPKFQEMGVQTIALGNLDKWQYNSSWCSALADRYTGSDWTQSIIDMDGTASFTDEDFVKFLELTSKIGDSNALNPDYESIGNQEASAMLLSGKAATTIDGYWNVEYTASNADQEMLDKIELAVLPAVEGGKGQPDAVAAGCGWFVGVNSKLEGEALEKALDLAMYMSGPALSQRMTDVGLVSTCDTVAKDPSTFSTINQKYLDFVANAENTCVIYDARINASVIATMNDQFVELLSGSTDPETAAGKIQQEYETICAPYAN